MTFLARAAGAEPHLARQQVLDKLRPFLPVRLSCSCEAVSLLERKKTHRVLPKRNGIPHERDVEASTHGETLLVLGGARRGIREDKAKLRGVAGYGNGREREKGGAQ